MRLLSFLEDQESPPDRPDPADKDPASEPLDDTNDESALLEAALVDACSEHCSKTGPGPDVDDEEDDVQRRLSLWDGVLPLFATHLSYLLLFKANSGF